MPDCIRARVRSSVGMATHRHPLRCASNLQMSVSVIFLSFVRIRYLQITRTFGYWWPRLRRDTSQDSCRPSSYSRGWWHGIADRQPATVRVPTAYWLRVVCGSTARQLVARHTAYWVIRSGRGRGGRDGERGERGIERERGDLPVVWEVVSW